MRIVRPVLLLASLTLAFGCQPPSPEAPTEVSELSRYLYREWANPDPEAMEAGLLNLWDFLADVDLESANVDRSWVPEVLEPEDVTDIQRPEDRELSALLAISMAGRSVWPVADHGALQMEEDQRPAEPTAPVYIRTPRNLSDVSCFPTRECGPVETDNEVRRENLHEKPSCPAYTQGLALHRQPSTLPVRQPKTTSTYPLGQDPILFQQVVDGVLLLPGHRVGEHRHHELQGEQIRLHGSDPPSTSPAGTSSACGSRSRDGKTSA